jgi:hypothetical protein
VLLQKCILNEMLIENPKYNFKKYSKTMNAKVCVISNEIPL